MTFPSFDDCDEHELVRREAWLEREDIRREEERDRPKVPARCDDPAAAEDE